MDAFHLADLGGQLSSFDLAQLVVHVVYVLLKFCWLVRVEVVSVLVVFVLCVDAVLDI